VTLAASFAPLGEGMKLDLIDSARMQTSGRAVPAAEMTRPGQTRAFVACGRPLPTLAMRILGEAGQDLGERQVGRIQLKGPSLALGYFRAGEDVKPITNDDGWFETGDLGYWLGDQVVITGRFKDMILWNGRNIWPQDIEWVAQHVGGKNISRAAAFDIEDRDGTTRIMLLAECWSRDAEVRTALAHEVVAATRAATGAPVHLELVSLRTLPMTSSGKLSRSGARNRYLAGGFADLAADDAVAAPVAVATPTRGA
jgi:fatty-acyl-CoA synthase